MKRVVTKSQVYTVGRSDGNGEVLRPLPLTAMEYNIFKDYIATAKQGMYNWIKPRLAKGGFYFDPSSWVWTTTGDKYNLYLWCTITWYDEGDIGKAAFMNELKKTGIMDYDPIIIKPYS